MERPEVAPISRTFAPDPATARFSPEKQTSSDSPALWKTVVDRVKVSSPRLGTSLGYGRLVELSSTEVVLSFSKDAAFHRSVLAGVGRTEIEKLASEQLGRLVRLRLVDAAATGGPSPPSPAEEEAKEKADRDRRVEALVRGHPAVAAALELLGGEIEQIEVIQPEPSAGGDASKDTA